MAFSILRILTYVLGLVGTSLLLPLGVALWKGETAAVPAFLAPMLSGWGVAAAFWLFARRRPRVLHRWRHLDRHLPVRRAAVALQRLLPFVHGRRV